MKKILEKNKWKYIFKWAFLLSIMLGIFYSIFIGENSFLFGEPPSNAPAKLIVGIIVETVAYAVITLPFGILVGLSLWKTNKRFQ